MWTLPESQFRPTMAFEADMEGEPMDALVVFLAFVGALAVLGALASLDGHDSRDRVGDDWARGAGHRS
jgi:hypothetical protein